MAKIEMKNWVKRMVERHAQVVVEINKANEFLNNALNNKDVNKVTVANLALVVRDLKNLAKDYEIILHNENVEFTPDQVDSLTAEETFPVHPWWKEHNIKITSYRIFNNIFKKYSGKSSRNSCGN